LATASRDHRPRVTTDESTTVSAAPMEPAGQLPLERQSISPPPDSPPDFDKAMAIEHVDGDEAILKELLETFLSEYPPLLAQIRDAVTQQNAQDLAHAAHTLKGAAAAVAALAAADAAKRLETMGRTGDLAGATEVCHELEAALRRLRPVLLAV
ncbi:MAG: Hpt domain-containing protein, partial [Planctomycetes bacterium]|nr:Hpt domain-containing protein [Planctomycetota bacterium]